MLIHARHYIASFRCGLYGCSMHKLSSRQNAQWRSLLVACCCLKRFCRTIIPSLHPLHIMDMHIYVWSFFHRLQAGCQPCT